MFLILLLTFAVIIPFACDNVDSRKETIDTRTNNRGEPGTSAPAARAVPDLFALEPPRPWARPVDDYFDAARRATGHERIIRSIGDLAAFEDRLYFAYGDGNVNLGRIRPLEIRAFRSNDPASLAAEFVTDEEKIHRLRAVDGALIIPGFDHVRDEGGIVYRRDADRDWRTSRTLEQAMHVHDVAVTLAAIYACGSGGTPEEFARGDMHGLVYRSDDGGESFTLLDRLANPNSPGDNRFTNMLAIDERVFLFGHQTDRSWNLTAATCCTLVDGRILQSDLISNVVVQWTINLTRSAGLISGVRRDSGMRFGLWRADDSGAHRLEAFNEVSCLDTTVTAEGSVLLLVVEGSAFPTPPTALAARVLRLDGETATEILRIDGSPRPCSVEWWNHALYLGMEDGSIWRSSSRKAAGHPNGAAP